MKLLILQIEDRNNPLLDKLMNKNKIFCKKHNIEYIYLKKSSFAVPPYWAKIFEINKLLSEKPYIDYIIWLDSDAFF